jgi:hypothetical protein
MKKSKKIYVSLFMALILTIPKLLVSQMIVEGGYLLSTSFGYQKDDSYPLFSQQTQKFERIPTYLGQDYTFKQFKIGIGYKFKNTKLQHTIVANYNRKGAGANFAVDIFLDEFSKEILGSILVGHIQFGGYTTSDTDYMFGIWYDNIGIRYSMTAFQKKGIRINPLVQFDYAYSSKNKIISINNKPVPVTTNNSMRNTKIDLNTRKYLISLGLEVEIPINNLISTYISAGHSFTSYTKKGDFFSNRTHISTLELGIRFYQ